MTATQHHADTLEALERYGFIYNINGKIDPEKYYKLTTYGGIPAIQQDPRGQYLGMFGYELLCIIDRHNADK